MRGHINGHKSLQECLGSVVIEEECVTIHVVQAAVIR